MLEKWKIRLAEVCTDRPCLILVQSFSASIFSRIYALIISDTNFYQFGHIYIILLNGPDKKPKQNSSKTKRHSQQQEAKSVRRDEPPSANKTFFRRVVAGTSRWLLVCIAYCIFWHLIGSDQLSYFS